MEEKIKLTGNTIKSKVMPEYIETFIDKGFDLILHGKGKEFVEYYYDYVDDLQYKRIPLKKIATKNRVKMSLSAYKKRGTDKNGRDKAAQAHMELLIEKREKIAEELFQLHKSEFTFRSEEKLDIDKKMKLVANYMPPEPELDSVVYQVNTGYLKSHGNSNRIIDKVTGEERFAATIISGEDLMENPNMTGDYNVVKYLDAFNSRVSSLLVGFSEKVQNKMLSKFVKVKSKDEFGNRKVEIVLTKGSFDPDDLVLRNFDKDNYEESMYLEKKEVEFWNNTGYDPRLVWDGFKLNEDHRVYYEIYEGALKYLNDLMDKKSMPRVKSINDKYENGDLILIKDGSTYHVGAYNGTFITVIRENVEIPKGELELELDRKKAEEEERLRNLEITLAKETEREGILKVMIGKYDKYFPLFLKKFGLPDTYRMDTLFAEVPEASLAFDTFIKESEKSVDDAAAEYLGDPDDGGDGPY